MLQNLKDYLKLNIEEETQKSQIQIIENKLLQQIQSEKDFFKFLSFQGIYSLIKLSQVCHHLLEILKDLYDNFLGYLVTGNIKQDFIDNYEEKLEDFIIYKFARALFKDQTQRIIYSSVSALCFNDELLHIYYAIFICNIFSKKIILKYDDSLQMTNNKIFLFKEFYSKIYINLVFNIEIKKTIIVSYSEGKFSSEVVLLSPEKEKELSEVYKNKTDFNILVYYIKNNFEEKKIINIKNNLNKSINFLEMEEVLNKINELEKEFKKSLQEKEATFQTELQKHQEKESAFQIELQKKESAFQSELQRQQKKIIELEKEIKNQNKKIESLTSEQKDYYALKGRFIYKCFSDYFFLIFGINYNEKLYNKKSNLFSLSKNYKINGFDLLLMISECRGEYYTQTDNAHWTPKEKDVKTIILSFFDKKTPTLSEKIIKIFEKLSPEKDIIYLLNKNDEITKIIVSDGTPDEKENKKKEIIDQINNYLNSDRRKNMLEEIKKIFPLK